MRTMRQARIDLSTPIEQKLREALRAIEEGPADVRMTKASTLVQEALAQVGDYVDEQIRDLSERGDIGAAALTCRGCLLARQTVDISGYCVTCRVIQQSVDTRDRLPCDCETKTGLHHGDCASNDPHGASKAR